MLQVCLLVILIGLILGSVRQIREVQYGVVTRFGERTGRVLTEGLNFVVPLIDRILIFDYKLDVKVIALNFFSKDNLEVTIRALVQLRPDWNVKTKEGRNRFVENDGETITNGINEAIKSIVGDIVGQVEAGTFIVNKKAIERYIDCVLRLMVPPHMNPSGISPELVAEEAEEIEDAGKLVEFYRKYSGKINLLLAEEAEQSRGSELEERYGIEIVAFDMGDIDFSEETKKALEFEKQTEVRIRGFKLRKEEKIEMTEKFKKTGLNSQAALNAAETTMDQAERKITSVEGLENLKLLGGK